MGFISWLLDAVEWGLVLPAMVLCWVWQHRYAVVWVSSLSALYFSLITLTYCRQDYPENALALSLTTLFLLLTRWGYYKHRKGRDEQPLTIS